MNEVNLPLIAVVGRPNVGKSTLFNRILGRREALVHDTPGVTRDRKECVANHFGKAFSLVDTGGILLEDVDDMMDQILIQAQVAVGSADHVVFVVDGKSGIIPADREIASYLRKSEVPVTVWVNKIDTNMGRDSVGVFYSLGFDRVFGVSGEHGHGVSEAMDLLVEEFPEDTGERAPSATQIAIVGRPNVGKSSITNWIIGENRQIVSDISGTTRDWVDIPLEMDGKSYLLIDTAGIRKRSKTKQGPEVLSVVVTKKRLEKADVAVLVIDAVDGVTHQDATVARYMEDASKARVIYLNKWDLLGGDEKAIQNAEDSVERRLGFLQSKLLVRGSALTGKGAHRLMPAVEKAYQAFTRTFPTAKLNQVIKEAIGKTPPPMRDGRPYKVKYAVQVRTSPPTVMLFANHPKSPENNYRRYLQGVLNRAFDLQGSPVNLVFKHQSRGGRGR